MRAIFSSSMTRQKGEYSTCTAAMGWTACARRSVAEEISESPRYRTLPSLHRISEGAVEWLMDGLLDEFRHCTDRFLTTNK